MAEIRKLTKTVVFYGEAIQFTGDNGQEILKWITDKGFNGNDLKEPIYRPKSIPNLPYKELLEWWLASGEEKVDFDKYTGKVLRVWNTHDRSNCPDWLKDEIMCIPICDFSQGKGFVKYEKFKKDGWLVFMEGENYDYMEFYDKFPDQFMNDVKIEVEENNAAISKG